MFKTVLLNIKKKIVFILIPLVLFSCNKSTNLTPQQLRNGKFKTTLNNGEYESYAYRNDSIQIETYNNKKDTFYIKWINNFEYHLIKKHPKNNLDNKPFIVKITGLKRGSYSFTAHFKGSNYKQKGIAFKANNTE